MSKEAIAYVFEQKVTRIYEKQVIKTVHIRNKGEANEREEIEYENVGWVLVLDRTTGYLFSEKPDFDIGQIVEIVIRAKG